MSDPRPADAGTGDARLDDVGTGDARLDDVGIGDARLGDARLTGTVRVVGTGLLGTSIGLGLGARGIDVVLDDTSPAALRLALDYGAGRAAAPGDAPRLIVVCVPPDVTARTVARELEAFPDAVVTDVASVKAAPLDELSDLGADLARYVGSHPMAGRERGGAVSGRADLFVGRPWVVAAHPGTPRAHSLLVEQLALDLGAVPVELSPDQHDAAVALVSHVPQLVSTLLARRLLGAPPASVALAGQGLRDTTRIAASDPELWVQILGSNAPAVAALLRDYRDDLDALIGTLEDPARPGARRALAETIASGGAGVATIPGKHGEDRRYSTITVMVDDRAGQIARLLTDIGEAGVNLEDLRLEHSPEARIGFAELQVLPEAEQWLVARLDGLGWRIAEVDR